MTDCLFCKIIAGEIPSEKVYEDEDVFAFLDIKPVNLGHALVVPKKHCANLLDVDPETLKKTIAAIPKIAKAVMSAFDYQAFNLGVNNGALAGQLVAHLHFHIIPRKEGDGHLLFPGKPYASAEEMKNVGEKIRAKIV
ncbi:MAG: HIT family protein [Parcubacteria group bacterium]